MGIYWSASKGGFYDEAVHGSRMIWVVAEAAQEAQIDALIEDAISAAWSEEMYGERFQQLIDNPLMELITNTDCTIPQDALPIDPAHHAELIQINHASGKPIISDESGMPMIGEISLDRDEIKATVRRRRDAALAASDWTQLADAPLDKEAKAKWRTYRTALRDLTQVLLVDDMTYDNLSSGKWMPTPPS